LKGIELEELDEDAQQRRETFARYGLVMYHTQCVEKSLAILVSTVFNEEFLTSSSDRREEILDDVFAKTTGRLLIRLREKVTLPPNLDETLRDAHRKRNWLAHEYFWDRAGDLLTTAGRKKMIDELTVLYQFFSDVDVQLTPIYDEWIDKVGLRESIDKAQKEIKSGK
jgi:hypothetical protein